MGTKATATGAKVVQSHKQRFILNFIRLASGDLVNLTFGSESRNNIN
jgi:hypothetical protein